MFGAEDDGMQFQPDGYLLMFHPDLLRNTPLGRIMREYSFFSYETNEALHLSVEERQIIMDCFHKIQYELNHPIHRHSKNLITDSIKTFLDYCTRFYDRQFITRDNQNRDILARFERLLDEYFHDGAAKRIGLPTVQYCADKLCLSPNYFSDLLKKSEMRKNMVMDLIYRGFIYAANYSESHYNPRRSQIKTELRYLFVTTPNR